MAGKFVEALFLVQGKVQGVSYREHCHNLAVKHGVAGYAKNSADGSVEILACSTPERVDAFANSLRTTRPIAARVDIVTEMSRKACTAPGQGFQRL
jgi:acylphosphatase